MPTRRAERPAGLAVRDSGPAPLQHDRRGPSVEVQAPLEKGREKIPTAPLRLHVARRHQAPSRRSSGGSGLHPVPVGHITNAASGIRGHGGLGLRLCLARAMDKAHALRKIVLRDRVSFALRKRAVSHWDHRASKDIPVAPQRDRGGETGALAEAGGVVPLGGDVYAQCHPPRAVFA